MKFIKRKKQGSIMENMIVMLLEIVVVCAFIVIIFGAFSGISNKWGMRQVAREYILLMETEGYLNSADQTSLRVELESYGLYNVSFSGTTVGEVDYGERIYLSINGTYDDNILAFAEGISKYTTHPSSITIHRQSTAKQ